MTVLTREELQVASSTSNDTPEWKLLLKKQEAGSDTTLLGQTTNTSKLSPQWDNLHLDMLTNSLGSITDCCSM
jgi:hypothetical protein